MHTETPKYLFLPIPLTVSALPGCTPPSGSCVWRYQAHVGRAGRATPMHVKESVCPWHARCIAHHPVTSSSASSDVQAGFSAIVPLFARMWRHAALSDVNGLAAEIALRSFLAFIPFFVVIVTLGGVIGARADLQNPADQAFGLIAESLSPEVSTAIHTELERVLT